MVCNLITQSVPRYPISGGGYGSVDPGSIPDAITDLAVEILSATTAELTWTPNGGIIAIYRRDITEDGSWELAEGDIAGNIDSFVDTDLTPENEYEWRVTASNGAGTSGFSNVVSDTTLAEDTEEYLYETTFADMAVRSYSDENVNIGEIGWYWWVSSPATLAIVESVEAPSGKRLQCTFTSGSERTAGIVSNTPVVGAGKRLHVAIDLQYTGYSDLGGIKKTLRFKSGGTIVGTLNAQYNKWIWDLADSGGGYYEQSEGSADTHGPNTFIGTRRRLEAMLDFTDPEAPLYSIWVDGTLVLSGTSSAADTYPTDGNVDGTYVSTTFNGPAATGSDLVDRIIFNDSYIGV
jgi:hypothetical protein